MKKGILLLVMLLVFPNVACQHRRPQAITNGCMPGQSMLCGRVIDGEGNPAVGAIIKVSGPALGCTREVTTDSSGYYWFPQLPPGSDYELTVIHAAGWKPVVRLGIKLLPFTTLSITLWDSGYPEHEVNVVASGSMIDYTKVGGYMIFQSDQATGVTVLSY
jgi:hypothetical protein